MESDSVIYMKLEAIGAEQFHVFLLALGVVGLVYAFLGYGIFRFILAATGFMLAAPVAALLVGWLSNGHVLGMTIAGVIGGICGGFALFFLYKFGVFCLGAVAAGIAVVELAPLSEPLHIVGAALGAGLAGGLLALWIERPAMTLATAAVGAWLTSFAVAFYWWGGEAADLEALENETVLWNRLGIDETGQWVLLGGWLGLTVVGTAVQWSLRWDKKKVGD